MLKSAVEHDSIFAFGAPVNFHYHKSGSSTSVKRQTAVIAAASREDGNGIIGLCDALTFSLIGLPSINHSWEFSAKGIAGSLRVVP